MTATKSDATARGEAAGWKPVEVAYYLPGTPGWKRARPRTRAAYDRLIDRLAEEGAEIRLAD